MTSGNSKAEIGATEFKAKCLELMDRVASRRETFVITKHGRPVAKLVPLEKGPRESIFGCMRGQVRVVGDIVSPALPFEDWETLDEWDQLQTGGGPTPRRARLRKKRQRR
jgi:prevent-host-death family protein